MKVVLNENGYFTGQYCEIGDLPNSVEVNGLPDETDSGKLLAYQLFEGEWVFDEQNYQQLLKEKEYEEQKRKNRKVIDGLKKELEGTDYKIIKCMEASLTGSELPYDVSSLHMQRQAIRDEINELERVLENTYGMEMNAF